MTYTANLCNSSNTNYHIENCNMHYQLAKVDSIIDLGVRFDSKLLSGWNLEDSVYRH